MQSKEWIIRPLERKQISLVKIPAEVASKFHVRDGVPVNVRIILEGVDLYRGPLTVTSGQELYIPKNVRGLLKNTKEFKLSIV